MSCCGRSREAARKAPARWARGPSPSSSRPGGTEAAAAEASRVEVRFVGRGGYLVAGPASRDIYRFSADAPRALIDARDLAALLRTGLFEIAER